MTTTSAIELTNVTKTFPHPHTRRDGPQHITAVNHLDLRINRGEVVALLGPNGAGKTTTIDLIAGYTNPTSGTVRTCGTAARDVTSTGKIGIVAQHGGLLPDLTVEQTLNLAAAAHGVPSRRVIELLQRSDLNPLIGRRIGACSGGEQQRIRCALALLADPEILFLDEPTTGMDVQSRRAFWADMESAAHEGRTIVFATHYLAEAEAYAERIVIMQAGQIVADGDLREIQSHAGGNHISICGLESATSAPCVQGLAVLSSRTQGDRTEFLVAPEDSDELCRRLLAQPQAHSLTAVQPSLEDAFVMLTGQQPPAISDEVATETVA